MLKPLFYPDTDCLCRKPFVAMGKQFEPGDPFPWMKLGITEAKAKKMYNAGYFAMADDPSIGRTSLIAGVSKQTVSTPPEPSYKELQALCKEAGMAAGGTTEELKARLEEYADMKNLCEEKGIDSSGTMQELEERYDAHAAAEAEAAGGGDGGDTGADGGNTNPPTE